MSIYWHIWRFRGHFLLFEEDFCTRSFMLGSIQLQWSNKDIGARFQYDRFISKLRWSYWFAGSTYTWSMQAPIHFEKH